MRLLRALIALIFSFLAFAAAAEVPVPPLKARLTDLTGTLTQAEQARIEQKLAAFEAKKGSQIAVLLVPTTQPESIEQFGIRVADTWKLGRRGVDDGLILIVAKDDRAVRIEVGYGLEGVIPDAVAKRVIEEIIVPRFRQGDFAAGLEAGVDALIQRIEGEPLPPAPNARGGPASFFESVLPVAFLFVFVLGPLLRGLFGRLIGASIAGGVAFFGAWLLLGSWLGALIIAFVVFLIALMGVTSTGSPGGGFGGWGGGFPGGGGGWSGGGGGFGGGGASGRW